MSEETQSLLTTTMELMATLFIILIGLGVLWAVIAFIVDISQTKHAIRRNYPVIGRFRYFFEKLGEFFRQYFFAMDREELPFNRAQRTWVYRAAKDIDNTVAFGSTRNISAPGQVMFVNLSYRNHNPRPEAAAGSASADQGTAGRGLRKKHALRGGYDRPLLRRAQSAGAQALPRSDRAAQRCYRSPQ